MRLYRLPFNALNLGTTASGEELWAITTGSSLQAVLEEVRLDPCATSVSEFSLSINLFGSTYTTGSGGATLTPAKTDPGDAAASFTCKTQNTTKAVINTGTKTILDAGQWQLVNGWVWQPLSAASRIVIPISSCLCITLDTTPASQTVSGCAIVSEGI